MVDLNGIVEPTLLLDEEKCRENICFMAEKARRHKLRFRPHFKTHQSRAIGAWFKNIGVNTITVSSLNMALYFSDAGWTDITVAFPANLREIDKINHLAGKVKLNLLLTAAETAKILARRLKGRVGVFIKVDTGYHRAGIFSGRVGEIDEVLRAIDRSRRLEFRGFLAHAGNTYAARTRSEILKIHHRTLMQLNRLKVRYRNEFPGLILSLGDTPACSVADDFNGIDEIRPGNFVFYDVMQYRLGVCPWNRIAVCLACPVVARNASRNELVIYGGAVHFSKEYILGEKGDRNFGLVVRLRKDGWSRPIAGMHLAQLSQEHGIIKGGRRDLERFKIGDIVGVLPVHSCLTANLMKGYQTTAGVKLDYLPATLTFPAP
jgi:D-serine deaminase-like pyridoxal phosphate-dependent protein